MEYSLSQKIEKKNLLHIYLERKKTKNQQNEGQSTASMEYLSRRGCIWNYKVQISNIPVRKSSKPKREAKKYIPHTLSNRNKRLWQNLWECPHQEKVLLNRWPHDWAFFLFPMKMCLPAFPIDRLTPWSWTHHHQPHLSFPKTKDREVLHDDSWPIILFPFNKK